MYSCRTSDDHGKALALFGGESRRGCHDTGNRRVDLCRSSGPADDRGSQRIKMGGLNVDATTDSLRGQTSISYTLPKRGVADAPCLRGLLKGESRRGLGCDVSRQAHSSQKKKGAPACLTGHLPVPSRQDLVVAIQFSPVR